MGLENFHYADVPHFAVSLEEFFGKVFSRDLLPTRQALDGAIGASGKRAIIKAATVQCNYCGVRGQAHAPWQEIHEHHVRCTCQKVVTRRGLGSHLAYMRKVGRQCPYSPMKA